MGMGGGSQMQSKLPPSLQAKMDKVGALCTNLLEPCAAIEQDLDTAHEAVLICLSLRSRPPAHPPHHRRAKQTVLGPILMRPPCPPSFVPKLSV